MHGNAQTTRGALAALAIASIIAVAALMWPALYNGQPFFHDDTIVYLGGADAGLETLTGLSSRLKPLRNGAPAQAQTPRGPVVADGAVNDGPTTNGGSAGKPVVLLGRSVYYGALLALGDRTGDFWGTVLIQAVVLMLAMGLFFKAFGVPLWPHLAVAGVAMAALTQASFYVSFLMPDLFAAVTLLACATLIGARSLRRVEYCLWTALLAFSLMSHSSHVLIAAALLSFALLIDLKGRSWANWRGLAIIAGCLMLAAAAEAVFGMSVTKLLGAPPLRPPFLMARAIEDGPGYRYMRDTCPGSGFKVCEFLPLLPLSADDFLWSWDTPPGVFAPASADVRRELSAEQYRFFAAVLRYDPVGIARGSIRDVLHQFTLMGLAEFNENYPRIGFAAKLPLDERAPFRASPAYRGTMPTQPAAAVQTLTFFAASTLLLAAIAWPRLRQNLEREQLCMLAFLGTGIVLNAAICGAMSGPHDRYEARVAWLVPFSAFTVGIALWKRRGRTVGRLP